MILSDGDDSHSKVSKHSDRPLTAACFMAHVAAKSCEAVAFTTIKTYFK
jgi:hypothetical protein